MCCARYNSLSVRGCKGLPSLGGVAAKVHDQLRDGAAEGSLLGVIPPAA